MYNLLVFLVLTASVGQLKCQDWISWPRRNGGCPEGTQLDVATDVCVITVEPLDNICPAGTELNDRNECVPIEIRRVAAPDAFKAGCIPGTSRDPYTGQCVSCPPGSERDGATNECVVILDTDKRRVLVVGCPDGYIRNDKGKCVQIGSRRVAAPDAVEGGCISGTFRDPYTGQCVSCPPGSERDGATNECVVILDTDKRRLFVDGCPDGYVRNDKGKCVQIGLRRVAAPEAFKAGCIPGTSRDPNTGECVSCPPGQERDGETNECVVIVRRSLNDCSEGSIRNNKGQCVRIVPKRVSAALDLLKGGCISGTTRDPATGKCVGCPPGSERDGKTNECVVIVKRSVDGCPAGTVSNDKSQCIPIGLRRVAAPDAVEGGCISGTFRDPYTGECVSCPPGSERDGATNECVVILDTDKRRLLGNMETYSIGLRRVAALDAVEGGCIPGTTKDPTTGECVSCPPGSELNDATNECVVILDVNTRSLLNSISQRVINWIVNRVVT